MLQPSELHVPGVLRCEALAPGLTGTSRRIYGCTEGGGSTFSDGYDGPLRGALQKSYVSLAPERGTLSVFGEPTEAVAQATCLRMAVPLVSGERVAVAG